MAIPTLTDIQTGQDPSAATTRAIALGAGTGDKIIIAHGGGTPAFTTPTDWTHRATTSGLSVYWRAGTSETTVDLPSNNVRVSWISATVVNGDLAGMLSATASNSTTATPTPASDGVLTGYDEGIALDDYLVIPIIGYLSDTITVTDYPVDAPDNQTFSGIAVASQPSVAMATRDARGANHFVAKEYTLSASTSVRRLTLAIPAASGSAAGLKVVYQDSRIASSLTATTTNSTLFMGATDTVEYFLITVQTLGSSADIISTLTADGIPATQLATESLSGIGRVYLYFVEGPFVDDVALVTSYNTSASIRKQFGIYGINLESGRTLVIEDIVTDTGELTDPIATLTSTTHAVRFIGLISEHDDDADFEYEAFTYSPTGSSSITGTVHSSLVAVIGRSVTADITTADVGFISTIEGGAYAAIAIGAEAPIVLAEFDFAEEADVAMEFEAFLPPPTTFDFAFEDDIAMPFTAEVESAPVVATFGFATESDFSLLFTTQVGTIQPIPFSAFTDIGLSRNAWNCGEWTVWLADRFGNPHRQLRSVASLSGSPIRVIDDVSDISVTFGEHCDDDLLCLAEPWANEIQLRIDGAIAWAGPIQNVEFAYGPDVANPLSVTASDLLQWLSVRLLDGRIAEGRVATQFAEIIEEAMRGDDIGLVAHAGFVSVDGPQRITDISDALSEIIDIAPLLDFTMHGRTLLVGKEEIPFANLPTLMLPEHAISFTLKRLGGEEASQMWVRGGDVFNETDGRRAEGSFPESRVPDPRIGIVQRRVPDTMSIVTDDVATTVAYSAYQYARPPVWAIDVELDMGKVPFEFNDIIAGSQVPVSIPSLACFQSPSIMRIRSVGLELSGGEQAAERVTLELRPAGVFTDDLSAIALGL